MSVINRGEISKWDAWNESQDEDRIKNRNQRGVNIGSEDQTGVTDRMCRTHHVSVPPITHPCSLWWGWQISASHYNAENDLERSVMADCSLNPVTVMHQTTRSLPPDPAQARSTSACKYETALRLHVGLSLPGTPYITAWRPLAWCLSILQNHDGRPSVEEFESCKVQGLPGPCHCQLSWSEVPVRSLICQSVCLYVVNWSPIPCRNTAPANIQIPNEQKMCEKSHCGKSFLCIFTLVRREEGDKRRMEMRMKRARHERHILQEFVKRGRRLWLLLFLSPVFFSPFLDLTKSSSDIFVILFLHSCLAVIAN